jgi:choline dehydrogenase-like flavoprotein
LQNERDVLRMMQAWEAGTVAYPNVGVDIFPGPLVRKLWWKRGGRQPNQDGMPAPLHQPRMAAFARAMVRPYFHWMGTCAMQTNGPNNNDWVVDANFGVRHVTGLRVCDASVLPSLVSAPPALTCAALGHILASLLWQEAQTTP